VFYGLRFQLEGDGSKRELATMRISTFLSFLFLVHAHCAEWPEFLGPNRDNTSPETSLLERWPEKGPEVVWQKDIGTGYSAPSVFDGMLVLHHRIKDEEIVEALAADSGKPLWRHTYPSHFEDPFGYNNGPRCSPLLTDNHCFTFGAEGMLLCLDRKTGKVIWQCETAKQFEIPEAFFGVGSSPILNDGILIVQVGGQPNSGVAGFDAATGKVLWENVGEKTWTGVPMTDWPGERLVQWNVADPSFGKQASYCTPVIATIHGRKHLVCVTRQGLVSLDPKTGAHHFSFWFRARQDSSVNAMTPIVHDNHIFISSAYYKNGSVLLKVAEDGKSVSEVWRSLALEMHWSLPNLIDGHLYGFSGRNEPDAEFRCVEFATGKARWSRKESWPNGGHGKLSADTPPPDVFGRGSTIFADGKLIALGEAGLLGIFKPSHEKLEEVCRWQVPGLTFPCWAGPVLSNKRLYLRCEERLVCLDLEDKK